MESQKVYEDSYNELKTIMKCVGSDQVVIDFGKLDNNSSGVIRTALTNAVSKRLSDVNAVITGVR